MAHKPRTEAQRKFRDRVAALDGPPLVQKLPLLARPRYGKMAALERDAAIALLLEAPQECAYWKTLPLVVRCGECWPCRVDKFLRDAGVRR